MEVTFYQLVPIKAFHSRLWHQFIKVGLNLTPLIKDLLSCHGKLFLSILNNRLLKFSLDQNKFSESQLGFRKGIRTSDAHNNSQPTNNDFHKYSTKLYSCLQAQSQGKNVRGGVPAGTDVP